MQWNSEFQHWILWAFYFQVLLPSPHLASLRPQMSFLQALHAFLSVLVSQGWWDHSTCIYWFKVWALDMSYRWSHLALLWKNEEQLNKRYPCSIPGFCERCLICKRTCDYGIIWRSSKSSEKQGGLRQTEGRRKQRLECRATSHGMRQLPKAGRSKEGLS